MADLFRIKRLQFHNELIEEIRSRAPLAKVSISWKIAFCKNFRRCSGKERSGQHAREKRDRGAGQGLTVIKIIWGTLVSSLAVYLLVCKLMETQLAPMSPGLPIGTMRVIFFGIAMVTIAVTSYIRKVMLKISESELSSVIARRHRQPPAAAKYLAAIIVAMALSESIGIYGVVLFVLSKDAPTLYLFILTSAIAMLYYRPRKEVLRRLPLKCKF